MPRNRLRFLIYCIGSGFLVLLCLLSVYSSGDLNLGRHPIENFEKTVGEMSRPSFLNLWTGNSHFEYKSDDGSVLRTENQREVELTFLQALLRAIWVTFKIATLGSLLGAILGLPFGFFAARNLNAPWFLAWPSKVVLDAARSIHSLVFGLLFVGIVGLGPVAGILAIATHCLGTYGKLYAEAIETLDMGAIDAVRAVGASRLQVFFLAVWPAVLPQIVSTHLYVWEYNIRDSTVLGLIGAGGIGLLISEATSLFQWGRLTTLLLALIAMVMIFDGISRRLRRELL